MMNTEVENKAGGIKSFQERMKSKTETTIYVLVIPRIIPLKLLLDMVLSSSADVTRGCVDVL